MEEILASIRKIIPDDEDGPAPVARPSPEDATEKPELVLTQMLAEDGSVVKLATPPAREPQHAQSQGEPAPAPSPTPAVGETLEAFVRRVLEPQIKAWLEIHLPAIVDRMVQEAIDGIRRESEKDKNSR
jgi:cell pole-organizing protein PopZ